MLRSGRTALTSLSGQTCELWFSRPIAEHAAKRLIFATTSAATHSMDLSVAARAHWFCIKGPIKAERNDEIDALAGRFVVDIRLFVIGPFNNQKWIQTGNVIKEELIVPFIVAYTCLC